MYIYQADVYCNECGELIRREIDDAGNAPKHPEDEGTYDSDNYPKGPYDEEGEATDSPQHCGACGVFLETPLTKDGINYVVELIQESDDPDDAAVSVWGPHYGRWHDEISEALTSWREDHAKA